MTQFCRHFLKSRSGAVILLLMSASTIASVVFAKETDDTAQLRRLTVEHAVFLGLQNNPELLVMSQNPIIAGAFEQLEHGQYDPELFAELQHSRQNTSEVSRSTGQQFDVEVKQTEGEAGIRQRTPVGTEVTAKLSSARNDSSRTTVQYSSRLGLSVTQQLLRGFGMKSNLAGIHQAELETLASRHELTGFVETLVAEIETTYWKLVAAAEEIAVFEKSLDVAVAKLTDARERVAVGALPKNDIAQAEAEVARRKQGLIDAQSEREAVRIKLVQLISPRAMKQQETVSAIASIPVPEPIDVQLADSIALATQIRPELQEAEARLKKGTLEVSVTRNGVLPKLELFIDLGKTGYADSFGGSFSSIGNNTYDVTAGLRFSRHLGNRAAKAKQKIAVLERTSAEQSIENLRVTVEYDVRVAYAELNRAYQQTQVTAESRTFSAQSVASQQAKFDAGTAPALAVIQAERDLLESEIAEVKARVSYQIAKIQFFLAEGTLLQRRGIQIDNK
ncbi:MAG: TolC family protein [Deltaproteobacteria bacterium]|nr:TolC family protein [Deltaproteobacteria bacterium]MBN2670085.1 TolC family protein [Deltaproteobacteria bacterium]